MGHFYNALLFEGLCALVKIGQNGRNNGQTLEDVLRSQSYNRRPYVRLGYLYPHWKPSPAQTFYRIGTPLADEMAFEYVPDENHVSPYVRPWRYCHQSRPAQKKAENGSGSVGCRYTKQRSLSDPRIFTSAFERRRRSARPAHRLGRESPPDFCPGNPAKTSFPPIDKPLHFLYNRFCF